MRKTFLTRVGLMFLIAAPLLSRQQRHPRPLPRRPATMVVW
jgi:hypothetical protein